MCTTSKAAGIAGLICLAIALIGGIISWLVFGIIILVEADHDDSTCRANEVWIWTLVCLILAAFRGQGGKHASDGEDGTRLVAVIVGLCCSFVMTIYGTVVWAAVYDDGRGAGTCRDWFEADGTRDNLLTFFIVTLIFEWVALATLFGIAVYVVYVAVGRGSAPNI